MTPEHATLFARYAAAAGLVMVLAWAISAGAHAVIGKALDRWHRRP